MDQYKKLYILYIKYKYRGIFALSKSVNSRQIHSICWIKHFFLQIDFRKKWRVFEEVISFFVQNYVENYLEGEQYLINSKNTG